MIVSRKVALQWKWNVVKLAFYENFTFHVVDIIIKYGLEQVRIGLIVSPCLTVDFSTV